MNIDPSILYKSCSSFLRTKIYKQNNYQIFRWCKQIILSVYQSFCITSNYNWHCDSFQTTSCFFWKGIGLLKREPILVRIRTQDTVTWVTGMDFYQEAISKSSTWFFLLTFSSSHRRMWFISDLPPIAAWCIP